MSVCVGDIRVPSGSIPPERPVFCTFGNCKADIGAGLARPLRPGLNEPAGAANPCGNPPTEVFIGNIETGPPNDCIGRAVGCCNIETGPPNDCIGCIWIVDGANIETGADDNV